MKYRIFFLIVLCTFFFTGCKGDLLSRTDSKPDDQYILEETPSTEPKALTESVLGKHEAFLVGFSDYFTANSPENVIIYDKISLISGKGELIKEYMNASFVGNLGIIDMQKAYFMGMEIKDGYLFGLFNFRTMDWQIAPTYEKVVPLENGTYGAVNQEGNLGVIDENGKEILPFILEGENFYFTSIDDLYVYYNYMKNKTILLDEKGKHIEIEGIYFETFGEYIVIYDSLGKSKLYDKNGNIILGENLDADMQDQYEIYPNKYAEKLSETVGSFCTIFDTNLSPIFEVELLPDQYLVPQKYYYAVPDHAENNFIENYFDYKGNILIDKRGNPYHLSSEDYLFSVYDGKIDILDTRTMDRLMIDGNFEQDNTGISKMNDQLINVVDYKNPALMKIYDRSGKLLLEIAADYYFHTDEYIVLGYSTTQEAFMAGNTTIIDSNGKILYQAQEKEEILGIYRNLIFTRRGEKIGIVDFNGNWIWQNISSPKTS